MSPAHEAGNRYRGAGQGRFIEPMLCLAASKLPEGPAWQYEVKLDGYRHRSSDKIWRRALVAEQAGLCAPL